MVAVPKVLMSKARADLPEGTSKGSYAPCCAVLAVHQAHQEA